MMILFDPMRPGEEACEHLDGEGGLQTHVTPLTVENVTIYMVRGVPGCTFFYVKMICGMYFLIFRPPHVAEEFIVSGYPLVELKALPSEVAECYRREFGEAPLTEGEIARIVAELAGLATADDES